jgi:hypothetical protein
MSLPFLHHVSTTAAFLAANVEKSAIHHKYFLRICQITRRHIQKRQSHCPENVKPGLPETLG